MNEPLNIALISALVSGIVSGFTSWLVARYTLKSSEGKLKILRLEFHSRNEASASLIALLVNEGRGDIIIDTVLLRSKQGQEKKKKPTVGTVSLPNAPGYVSPGSPSSKKLAAEERLEVHFSLPNLEFPPQSIQVFEAIDTRDRRYTKKLSHQLRREIAAWSSSKTPPADG